MLRKQFCMFGEASKDQTGSSLAGWTGGLAWRVTESLGKV